MKSLFLFVYFVTMLAADPVSSGRNICLPCSEQYAYLCKQEEKVVCINDKRQLAYVLNMNSQYVANDVQRMMKKESDGIFFISITLKKTLQSYNKKIIKISIVITAAAAGFYVVICIGCRILKSLIQRKRIAFYKDLEEALTDADRSEGINEEEIRRPSFFKKNIDATLSRPEMRKLVNCMGSVGILYWNNVGRGTAVRIGPNFILTCWHVIEPIVLPAGKVDLHGIASVAMDFESLKNKEIVNVDFSENTRFDRRRFGLKPKACFLDKKRDICILELEADHQELPDPIDLFRNIQSIGMKTAKRFVHVIGQHPDSSSIVIDPGCEIILPENKKVKSAQKWIKKHRRDILRHGPTEKHIMESYDDVFETNKHLILDTYLEFGASGGAVVTITPDGKVALVAILMRGIPAWYWNERSQECGFPSELRLEVGCLISQILGSNEWIESERNRIFGFAVETEVNERMDTDEHDIHIQPRSGRASNRRIEEVIDMETDQGEDEAVDNELTRLTLQNTC